MLETNIHPFTVYETTIIINAVNFITTSKSFLLPGRILLH